MDVMDPSGANSGLYSRTVFCKESLSFNLKGLILENVCRLDRWWYLSAATTLHQKRKFSILAAAHFLTVSSSLPCKYRSLRWFCHSGAWLLCIVLQICPTPTWIPHLSCLNTAVSYMTLINIDNNSLFSPVYFLNVVSPYTRCAIHFLFTHTLHAMHYYYYVVGPSFKTNNKTKQHSVANYIWLGYYVCSPVLYTGYNDGYCLVVFHCKLFN